MKLLAFDIDGTLSPHGKTIPSNVSQQLRLLESQGHHIAFVSGKPAYYLSALSRGMGLQHTMLIGENGCVIFDLSNLEEIHIKKRIPEVDDLERKVQLHFGSRIWLQPNRVALTVFPKIQSEVPEVADYVRNLMNPFLDKVIIYEHVDAVDIVPIGIDKGIALKYLRDELKISKENTIAFGDSTNDLPMFSESGKIIIIGDKIQFNNSIKFHNITQALSSSELKNILIE